MHGATIIIVTASGICVIFYFIFLLMSSQFLFLFYFCISTSANRIANTAGVTVSESFW